MLKKVLCLICILMIGAGLVAHELNFSYFQGNGAKVLKATNISSFTINEVLVESAIKYQSMNAGNLFGFNLQGSKDIGNKMDFFEAIDYLDDQILDIDGRLDLKAGVGYEFYNNYNHRHKVSAAAIYRGQVNKLLSSLRYKYVYTSKLINAKAIFYLIYPETEVRGDLSADLKVAESIALTTGYNFSNRKGLKNYLTTAGIKILY